jgi:hypothetical protein
MRTFLRSLVGVAILAAGIGVTAPALATPGQGGGLGTTTAQCGDVTVTVTAPPNNHSVVGFVAGGVYLTDSVTVTAPDGTVLFSKVWGQRTGVPGPFTCTATDAFNDTITITVSGPAAH